MNKIKQIGLTTLVLSALIYFSISFIKWQSNPSLWSEGDRIAFCVGSFIFSPIISELIRSFKSMM